MGKKYGVWLDHDRGDFFVSLDIDPYSRYVFAITLEDHTPNIMLTRRLNQAALFKPFIEAYKNGRVYYEDMNIKNITYEVIRLSQI